MCKLLKNPVFLFILLLLYVVYFLETLDRLKRDNSVEYCARSTLLQVQRSTTAITRSHVAVLSRHPPRGLSLSTRHDTALPPVAAVTLSERILLDSSYEKIYCRILPDSMIRIGRSH